MTEEERREESVTRETPREGERPRARPAFMPARRLLSDHERSSRDKSITLGVLLAGLLATLWAVLAARSEQRVFVVDPVGGISSGPLEPLASSRTYFTVASIHATQTAFQRSGVGFDLQELLPLYFSSRGVRELESDLAKRREDTRRRHLTTKPVIEGITAPSPAGDSRIVRVSGRVQATGAVNGRVFHEERPFALVLVYRANPDLGSKGAVPWVVDELDLAWGEDEIARQRARNRMK